MASAIQRGIQAVPGVQAEMYQVKETLSEEVLSKLHTLPKAEFPIATPDASRVGLKLSDQKLSRFGRPKNDFNIYPYQHSVLSSQRVFFGIQSECGLVS
ncbi:hypothetical protein JG687_00005641 [Phytophthora cactorum]|uniref:Uncharacterized protein n=1 Tax=Phytophthora cactorum TaxID=29920 RepID=A0A329SM75_9STRA|nr:hypothetical protein Pcac1_g15121 [Phytophthora cactorum]KAG2837407.1 hypothetical protein PC111_g4663 [Phytophthora cactorum]KAG2838234.1 hypothetical protein PC112_g4596 [Phytophthora cactorum]KAG2864250.1 hypothetical protein PC113_g4748 [Phytophthora cactorum]KAG2905962.1 hypothetical protein PC115_g14431 [Phytophthora cactorum]